MIPLGDDAASRRFPLVTWTILLANVAVFCFETGLGARLDPWIDAYALVPARLSADPSPFAALRAIAVSMFVHGGAVHLAGNLVFLHVFGDDVEERLGHLPYAVLYAGSGVAAALSHLAMFPESQAPMVGASGAIAGVTGAYFVFYRRARVATTVPLFFRRRVELPAALFIFFWFALQLLYGAASLGAAAGVAWWAHVGGFVAGAALGWFLKDLSRGLRRRAIDSPSGGV